MKNKRLISILAAVFITSSVAGCSSSTGSAESTTASTEQSSNQANTAAPAYEKPDVYGEVAEVIGNEVTLKLLEIPEMPAQGANGAQGSSASGTAGEKPAEGTGTGTGGGMRTKTYTGEQQALVIPVGTSLVTTTRGESGMTESEISLTELKAGYTLSVYYKEDGKTIEKISVRQPRTGGGQGGTGEKPSN